MTLTASDLIAYACANHPTDDTSLGGGGIDSTIRVAFTQLVVDDEVEAFSSSGSDTSVLTITGRKADGTFTSLGLTLTGTTAVASVIQFSVIYSVTYAGPAVGVLSLRRSPNGATICIVPAGEKGISMLFANAVSAVAQTIRYDKFFWKNVNGLTSLLTGNVRIISDPDSRMRQGIALAVNDSVTIANRLTAPAGITFVDDNIDQAIPGGGTLPAGSAIGVWVELTLPATDSEHKSTLTMQISGT